MNPILKERQRKGWTQFDLAIEAGVARSVITKAEKGACRPKPLTLERLAEALEVDVETLRDGEADGYQG